jgi:hypothetical protein
MSSSTALLPKDRKKDDHVGHQFHHQSTSTDICQPIFLRVCHSPWISIGQKALVGLRSLTAACLFVSFLALIKYELERNHTGVVTIFKFSNIAYFIQLLYHAIAAVSPPTAVRAPAAPANSLQTYTVMHLYYPHHGSQPQTWKTRMQKFLSPPRQHTSTKNRTWFSIFYTAANTFPLVSAAIHWCVLVPTKHATIPGMSLLP